MAFSAPTSGASTSPPPISRSGPMDGEGILFLVSIHRAPRGRRCLARRPFGRQSAALAHGREHGGVRFERCRFRHARFRRWRVSSWVRDRRASDDETIEFSVEGVARNGRTPFRHSLAVTLYGDSLSGRTPLSLEAAEASTSLLRKLIESGASSRRPVGAGPTLQRVRARKHK